MIFELYRAIFFWPWNENERTELEPRFWSFDWFWEHSANARAVLFGFWNMFFWRPAFLFDLSGERDFVHGQESCVSIDWMNNYSLYVLFNWTNEQFD